VCTHRPQCWSNIRSMHACDTREEPWEASETSVGMKPLETASAAVRPRQPSEYEPMKTGYTTCMFCVADRQTNSAAG
jgi:hypothetical protein